MTSRFNENRVGFHTIVRREVNRILRIWGQTIVPAAITATLYFVIFGGVIGSRIGAVSGYTYMQYIAPGLIMMTVITNSYGNVVSSFFWGEVRQAHRRIVGIAITKLSNRLRLYGGRYLARINGRRRGIHHCSGLYTTARFPSVDRHLCGIADFDSVLVGWHAECDIRKELRSDFLHSNFYTDSADVFGRRVL